jgi:hypothetical protein
MIKVWIVCEELEDSFVIIKNVCSSEQAAVTQKRSWELNKPRCDFSIKEFEVEND